jgi:hypothetical protein
MSDFENAEIKAELLEKLGQMIQQSGGELDMAALRAWFDAWLCEPLPDLYDATPAQAFAGIHP